MLHLCRGSQIFPTFVKFLKASGEDEKDLRSKLSSEFQSLGQHLEAHGPYLKGQDVSAGDLALGPKLYHVFTASKEFKVGNFALNCLVLLYLKCLQRVRCPEATHSMIREV